MPFIPEELTSAPVAAAEHKALWAESFMPSAQGEQRVRYKQDVADYAAQLQAQQKAHQDEVMAHDLRAVQVQHAQQTMDYERERHPLQMGLIAAQAERDHQRALADIARETARTNAETLANKKSAQVDSSHVALNNVLYSDTPMAPADRLKALGQIAAGNSMAMDDAGYRERHTAAVKQAQQELAPETPMTERERVLSEQNAAKINAPKATPPGALRDLEKLNQAQAARKIYLDNETDPEKKALLQKDVEAGNAAISAWKTAYQPQPVTNSNERITVTAPDGTIGHIPRSQLDEAVKAGYKPQ